MSCLMFQPPITELASYRRRCERFPHESTADQFFDEEQFEVYRERGDGTAPGAEKFWNGVTREVGGESSGRKAATRKCGAITADEVAATQPGALVE